MSKRTMVVMTLCAMLLLMVSGFVQALPPVTSGLIQCLDAAAGVQKSGGGAAADGDLVDTWVDQSGQGNTVSDATSLGTAPTYVAANPITGLPALLFSDGQSLAVADANRLDFAFGTGDFEIFYVAYRAGSTGYDYVCGNRNPDDGANGIWGGWFENFFCTAREDNVDYAVDSGSEMGTDAWTQGDWHRTSGDMILGFNGRTVGHGTCPANIDNPYDWSVGNPGGTTHYFLGSISEILVYNRSLTPAERESVRLYLQIKYGIPPTTTITPTVMSVGATPATVDFNAVFTGVTSVDLTAGDVTLAPSEGTVTGTVTIVAGDATNTPIIRLTGVTGTGKLRVCVPAGIGTGANGDSPYAVSGTVNVYPALVSFPASPVTNGVKLWWDASNVDGASNTTVTNGAKFTAWQDRSANDNDGTANGTGATLHKGVLNGHDTAEFTHDWINEVFFFKNSILDIRTVFWACSVRAGSTALGFPLGSPQDQGETYDWHPNNGGFLIGGYTSANVANGEWSYGGDVINAYSTDYRTYGDSIISCVTAGNARANNFGCDTRNGDHPDWGLNRSWDGNLSELIIYNRVLSEDEKDRNGAYLAGKYGLATPYGYAKPPKVAFVFPTTGSFVSPGETVDLKATAVPRQDGTRVTSVEFYVDGVLIGTDTQPNGSGLYTASWTAPTTAGSVSVFARATDNQSPSASGFSGVTTLPVVNPLFAAVTASGSADGSSWANAMTLSNAITAATAVSTFKPIYVKAGTYMLTDPYTFTKAMTLYGGFAGTELSHNNRGAVTSNVTTFDASGSYGNIITVPEGAPSLLVDRITFTNGASTTEPGGGAIVLRKNVTGTITDCTFTNNSAIGGNVSGGAITTIDNDVTIRGCVFTNNSCQGSSGGWGFGGAIAAHGGGNRVIDGCKFQGNSCTGGGSDYGGAICFWWGNGLVTNSVFVNNTARVAATIEYDGNPGCVINCTFVGNACSGAADPADVVETVPQAFADASGVFQHWPSGGVVTANCIFSNMAGSVVSSAAVHTVDPAVILAKNCLLNNATIDPTKAVATASLTGDPLFVNASDYHLQASSPAVDAGVSGTIDDGYSVPTADMTGLYRVNGPDLGAYETTVPGALAFTPSPVDFGTMVKGEAATITVNIANTGGNQSLTVSNVAVSGTGYTLAGAPTSSVVLEGGQSINVDVTFTAPVVTGRVPYNGTLTVTNTGTTNPATVALTAAAVPSLYPDTPPAVTVTRAAGTPGTTNAFPIAFTIAFDKPVTGFDVADISWTGGTVALANLGSYSLIPGIPAGTYTLQINSLTGLGSGTFTIHPTVPAAVCQSFAQYANLASTGNETVTVNTSLFGASITTTSPNNTDSGAVVFTITFDEDINSADPAALVESKLGVVGTSTGSSIFSVNAVAANPSSAFDVTVETGTDGTLTVSLHDDDTIMNVGADPLNGAGSGTLYGPMITVNKVGPENTAVIRPFSLKRGTNATQVVFMVVFSDMIDTVSTSDFAISGTGTTSTVDAVTAIGNVVYVKCTVGNALGAFGLSVDAAATLTNTLGVAFAGGTPAPDQDYYILPASITVAPTAADNAWTLY